MSDWGDRIKARREELGESQVELARACAVRPPSVNDWESGKTKTIEGGNLLAAARFLRVTPDWIIYGKEPKETEVSPSQARRLDLANLIAAYQLLRGTYADEGKVYDLEAEPDLLQTVYERLVALRSPPTPANLFALGQQVNRQRSEIGDGQTRGDGRVGGADSLPRKKRAG